MNLVHKQAAMLSALSLFCLSLLLAQAPLVAEPPRMIQVEPGTFTMGSDTGKAHEGPSHLVSITKPYLMSVYKVTYEEYDKFCVATKRGLVAARSQGRGLQPVSNVTWFDAIAYCNWLSVEHGLTPCYSGRGRAVHCDFEANGYRLPTEAEWEYAALGGHLAKSGVDGAGGFYAGFENPDAGIWHKGNSGNIIHPVGQQKPNVLGSYDMGGNIFDWCWDWFSVSYYESSPEEDPQGPPPPTTANQFFWEKSRRGGSWREDADACRIFSRSQDGVNYVGDNSFRLVRSCPDSI